MSPKVVVTHPIPESGLELLKKAHFHLEVQPDQGLLKKSDLRKLVSGADAIISLLTDQIDRSILEAAGPYLKIVANYAVGFDNIDIQAAKELGIAVTNTPDVVSNAVAEHTVALIFAVARRISESDRFIRDNNYHGWDPFLMLGQALSGKTLGIIGLGRIGSTVARICHHGLGMKVYYTDIKRNNEFERRLGATFTDLETLLRRSDVVSLHVPLLPTTRHLISWQRLKQMKPSAILINTARGPIVDEVALVRALREKEIFGAGIDVFEREPTVTPELKTLPNVVLTPHTASAATEAREAMSELAAQNVIAVLHGKKAITPIK